MYFVTLLLVLQSHTFDPRVYDCLQWRMIGPHRGGRTVGATGIPGHPGEFLIGVNNGGVWKTTDYGRIWRPIFDDQPTGSIGALAVAPSNPNVIYVGTGEGLQRPDLSTGDGMYKSGDGGKTWSFIGLADAQQIGAVLVDPKDENRVFVAALGHPYGPNEQRGVFRSVDGGSTWQKTLYKGADTGAIALAMDGKGNLYADLWSSRQAPWENGEWRGPGSGLYKSADGGTSWRQLTKGLPESPGRIGIGIAPSDDSRVYAVVETSGVFRSDDAGESWRLISEDRRVYGRGSDFAEIKVDPRNPDLVYAANTCAYRSTDGGATFTAFKGAPGGDDYHTIWIDPDNPSVMLFASDQGATITVNGGETWSSWYNQPTAQFYHVSTDNQFPYWVYGGQQESGSVGIASRGNDGQITFREWHPVAAEEYGYVAVDPLDHNIVYGGKLTKYDKRTGQAQDVRPPGEYRYLRTAPVLFAPTDPRTLFFAGNALFRTRDGAHTWEVISPDLSRSVPDAPAGTVFKTPARRGVIYSVGPSYVDGKTIWAGTDDGLVHVTRDGGKTWKDVTPPGMTAWSKVSQIDAGRFDRYTAYVAVNRIRLDDQRPHIYRTRDGGATWAECVNGLPSNAPVNTVREDPVVRGLLYCGTERAVFSSMDAGENWHPLRLNMPATSIRDLVVHEDDLVVGTHGRSFWILDNITPLRQLSSISSKPLLFRPQAATRVRWNMNTDTPLPPEEPAGKNPPDGAMIDYYLPSDASSVTLEVLGADGAPVRRYSSEDPPLPVNEKAQAIPIYWVRPQARLEKGAGSHRFLWDMRYPATEAGERYPMTAILRDTPRLPVGPWAFPGQYTVRLTVDGQTLTQPLTLRMDPRVKTSLAGLRAQFTIALGCWEAMRSVQDARLRRRLSSLMGEVDGADVAPTAGQEAEFRELMKIVTPR